MNSMPLIHSPGVRFTSRANACRCFTAAAMISRMRGSGVVAICSITASVMVSGVNSRMTGSFPGPPTGAALLQPIAVAPTRSRAEMTPSRLREPEMTRKSGLGASAGPERPGARRPPKRPQDRQMRARLRLKRIMVGTRKARDIATQQGQRQQDRTQLTRHLGQQLQRSLQMPTGIGRKLVERCTDRRRLAACEDLVETAAVPFEQVARHEQLTAGGIARQRSDRLHDPLREARMAGEMIDLRRRWRR